MKSGVLFSAEELQGLVKVSGSCVRVERRVRHIAMLPNCLADLKSSVNGILNSYQNRFDVNFEGFILGYKNVKILTDRATIINDDIYMHLDIEAEFYIFTPEAGCTLFGIVNKKSMDHIGCLVHKFFHVSIPRSIEETDEEWPGTSVNIGDQVTFTVEVCDFTGSLPYIRGKLLNSRPASGTPQMKEEVDSTSEPAKKKKKKKKHKENNRLSESAKCDLTVDSLEEEKKEAEPICCSPASGTSQMKEEVDSTSESAKKKKKKKHKENNRLSESAKCDLTVDSLEKEKKEAEPQHRKRKKHSDDEEAATEKKKKIRKLEGCETVYNGTPESEGLQVAGLFSGDVEYDTILENLKETYLKGPYKDLESSHKKKKKKKHGSHKDTDENKETVTKVAKDLQQSHECNGDEFSDLAQKVNKGKMGEKEGAKNHKENKEVGIESSKTKKRHMEKKSKSKGSKGWKHKEKRVKKENAKDHKETKEAKIESSKTKKRHKEKKSKTKDNKGKEHKEKKGKMGNAKDHRENKEIKLESSKTKKGHAEKERKNSDKGREEGKQEKLKGCDTEDSLKDLKTLASKLFNDFLQ